MNTLTTTGALSMFSLVSHATLLTTETSSYLNTVVAAAADPVAIGAGSSTAAASAPQTVATASVPGLATAAESTPLTMPASSEGESATSSLEKGLFFSRRCNHPDKDMVLLVYERLGVDEKFQNLEFEKFSRCRNKAVEGGKNEGGSQNHDSFVSLVTALNCDFDYK